MDFSYSASVPDNAAEPALIRNRRMIYHFVDAGPVTARVGMSFQRVAYLKRSSASNSEAVGPLSHLARHLLPLGLPAVAAPSSQQTARVAAV